VETGVRRFRGVREIGERLNIVWIGHSTVLVETEGVRVVTDPVLRPRVAHLRRASGPPVAIGGELDAVLVSHVHYDHLDVPSLAPLRARRIVVPRGAKRLLGRRYPGEVVEVEEGDEVSLGPVTVFATHAEHQATRWPLGPTIPSLGYLIRGAGRVYFAGDTDIFGGMLELGMSIDVALLPIDGWGPRVGPGHLDPQRAADALRLVRPRIAVPIHWGTYRRIGMHGAFATLRRSAELFERLAAEVAPDVEVEVLAPGERLEVAVDSRLGAAC
jgi:L-ascorbate metabolism protein UlaG (beta-lactamase superfamily)